MTSSWAVTARSLDGLPHIFNSSLIVKSEMVHYLFDAFEDEVSLSVTRAVAVLIRVVVGHVELAILSESVFLGAAAVDLLTVLESG